MPHIYQLLCFQGQEIQIWHENCPMQEGIKVNFWWQDIEIGREREKKKRKREREGKKEKEGMKEREEKRETKNKSVCV